MKNFYPYKVVLRNKRTGKIWMLNCDKILSLEPFKIVLAGTTITHSEIEKQYEILSLEYNKKPYGGKKEWQQKQ